jgi:hypothetical protein
MAPELFPGSDTAGGKVVRTLPSGVEFKYEYSHTSANAVGVYSASGKKFCLTKHGKTHFNFAQFPYFYFKFQEKEMKQRNSQQF